MPPVWQGSHPLDSYVVHRLRFLHEGHERQREAPACWPATLQPRWGAPGEDQASRAARVGKRGPTPGPRPRRHLAVSTSAPQAALSTLAIPHARAAVEVPTTVPPVAGSRLTVPLVDGR